MLKHLIGLMLAFALGAACRYFGLPVPAPPVIYGALMVFAVTLGYCLKDYLP